MDLKNMLNETKLRDMIRESWSLSWPITLIMFYEFLIGLTDVYVAGRFGKDVQAAYGLAFQIYFVFIILGIALSIGVVSVTSRLFTSDKKSDFNTAVNSSLAAAAVLGLIFTAAGILFSKDLINAMNVPKEVKLYAIPFTTVYSMAFLFDYVLMSTNGILRASAMVKKSLYVMTVVCVMNVALNFILPFATPLGFKGIAAATVASIFTGCILSLFYTRRLISVFKISISMVKNIFNISWPSGLLQAFWQTGSLVLFLILSMLPKNNVEIMAALTNGLRIESAIFLPAFAFNMANAVIVGNLLGKKENPDAFRGGLITAVMGVVIVTILTILVMLNAKNIAGFLSDNNTVITQSVKYIYIALIAEPIMAWGVILGGGLNGAGDTWSVMTITALSVWLVRIPLSYILGIYLGLGATAIWWAMNISILVQAILITRRYFNKRWITRIPSSVYE